MANEIAFGGPGSAQTCYVLIRDRTGRIWNTSGGTGAFETYNNSFYTDYAIAANEQGSNNYYTATMPAAIPAGVYNISAHHQTGGSAVQTDRRVAAGAEQWNGTALFPLSDLATSGQVGQVGPIRLAKGVQVAHFSIYLKSSADHVTPLTSGVVSGQVAKDAGNFAALETGTFTERGQGFYSVTLTSGDMNANVLRLLFTAVGISGGAADPLPMTIVTQRASGST